MQRWKLYSSVMWLLFGLVGFAFYLDVLVINWTHLFWIHGSDLSAMRTLV